MTTFSVVIPCLNGEATIARQLRSISAIKSPSLLEVIVADNGSTDGTASIVREHRSRDGRIRLVDASATRGINAARNAGVRASNAEFVLFVDADDEVQPEWFASMEAVVDESVDLVGGGVDRTLPSGTIVSAERQLYEMIWSVPWPIGANCGARRSVIESQGYFDESLRGGGDETEFFWRAQLAGHKLTLAADAVVTYYLRDSTRGTWRQHMAYGRSHAALFARFRGHGLPRASTTRAALTVAVCVIGLALPTTRRRSLERVAMHVGRVRGSLHWRAWYP